MKITLLLLICLSFATSFSQPIEQLQQFNGRYDYLAIGNTLNAAPNPCMLMTESSASLNLGPTQTLVAALMYWSYSGIVDTSVTLNGIEVIAERSFFLEVNGVDFSAAFADVTSIFENEGNGNYTFTDFDPPVDLNLYCGNQTDYGGWSVIIIYQDDSLPLNQLAIFDGFESVNATEPNLDFVLENIDVVNTLDANIGFMAWEGDASLAVNETLRVNGFITSNPPLNPEDNAFNGTNTYTNSSELFNMDLDRYDISNFINVGDTTIDIALTSGQDLIIVNNVVTMVNSELPDATIRRTASAFICGTTDYEIDFEVRNVNSTEFLPAGTPINVYADNTLIAQTETQADIPIGGSENGSVTVPIPAGTPNPFTLQLFIDEDPLGDGVIEETNESNNDFSIVVEYGDAPLVFPVTDYEVEDPNGDGYEIFDLTTKIPEILGTQDPADVDITFYETPISANQGANEISPATAYQNIINPQTIYVRLQHTFNPCYEINSFIIKTDGKLAIVDEVFESLAIYPNPTSGVVTIDGLKDTAEVILYTYDIQGALVSRTVEVASNGTITTDLSGLSEGFYFLEIETEGVSITKKLLKR